jgi:hypothetical protein
MKRTFRVALIAALWAGTLWICFWLGFLKSQTIALQTQHLDDLRLLSDQKVLLANISTGEASKAQEDLKERISIGDSLVRIHTNQNYGVFETLRYAIYPREALTLIKISNSEDQARKQN